MSIHTNRIIGEKQTSTARTTLGSTVLVAFRNRGHRLTKTEAAIRSLASASETSTCDRPTPLRVVIDFAQARERSPVGRFREEPSSEKQSNLTLADMAVIAYVTVATAFYPALAWLLIRP